MISDNNPSHRLLCELRRFAGETPLNARISPMQWVAIAKEAGITDKARNEAITYLRSKGFIVYKPESTEIIALTSAGLESADLFIRQRIGARVSDPLPQTLEEIRADMEYWQQRQFEGDPGSIWWDQVGARLQSLRHAENQLSLGSASPQSVTINNTLTGPNSRININTIDQSINLASATTAELFTELREKIEASGFDSDRQQGILNKLQELKEAVEPERSPTWVERYTQFIGTIADHVTVFQPLLSALLSRLTGM